ncbi:hypothetical protein L0657_09195 [Dyadobacter sp. CY345]|uniref:hypothetical protein n=1 Tax=Dyadobacter sp. CY345 TaxID=2909335 RepID=UPI001F28B4A1|nr:hypothetical protein [Dyadobacter sp. CY345]MCF2444131.1 hypothetical protein [Dyadobacter sp. CY345]
MRKSVFNDIYTYTKKNGDRVFMISMLTVVMIVVLAFKKPEQRNSGEDRNFSNVELKKDKINYNILLR